MDLVVAAAGIIESTASHQGNQLEYANEVMDVNVKGVINTIFPFIPKMEVWFLMRPLLYCRRKPDLVKFVWW